MTANTTTSTRRVAAGAVAQHDCAIAAAWPRCSGSRWVTPLPTTLRKVPRRAGDQYAAEARASADVVLSKVARPS